MRHNGALPKVAGHLLSFTNEVHEFKNFGIVAMETVAMGADAMKAVANMQRQNYNVHTC